MEVERVANIFAENWGRKERQRERGRAAKAFGGSVRDRHSPELGFFSRWSAAVS